VRDFARGLAVDRASPGRYAESMSTPRRAVPARSATVLAAALIAALAACGDDGHDHDTTPDAALGADAAGPRQVVSRTVAITSPALREGGLHLVAGDRVHVLASTAQPLLQWNVHTHIGGVTTIVGMGTNVATIDQWIDAAATNDYFLLLLPTSGSLSVAVTLELYGQAQYTGGLD